ncbi:hypothetical protein [Pseudochryseolinea flava]|uniref:TolC family protein n=1 Tax=Pseudochryseolinea flava TaxID=2059302 RepID=A0A364Y414_9BACT|nr:hypothetical protein [Pseudochryseolinea flava]RAW00555.1 hypothetical protein DQQ10_13225 [Pseudochryseolinea flava]
MKLMLRALPVLFSVLISATVAVYAQNDAEGFLLAAREDSEVKSVDNQIKYLDEKPYRLAPLQKIELRTASNQLDPTRQEYGLRVNPANPWELRNNNQYFRQYRSMLALERGVLLKEALYERYLLLADLRYHQELKNVRQKERELIDTYIGIMEQQQYSDFFDGEDYVKLKLDQIDRDVEAEEAAFERDDVARQITTIYKTDTDPTAWKSDTLTFERMMMIVDSIFSVPATPSTIAYHNERITLAKKEYTLEKANVNLGFVQATYEEFRKAQGRHPWSISAGVTIPIFNPNKGDMAKRKIEMMEEEQEKQEVSTEQQTASIRAREQLRNLIKRYTSIQEKIKSLRVDNISKTLNTMQGNNPAVRIRLNANILKLEIVAVKLKQSVYYAYIEFLAQMDVLQQTPMINYFTSDLRAME